MQRAWDVPSSRHAFTFAALIQGAPSSSQCVASFGTSSSDACAGTADPPGPTSAPIARCPNVDVPFMCVAYDQVGTSGAATKHECSCVPKCAMQTSSASSSGLEPADLCHCG